MNIEGYDPEELPQTLSYNGDGTLAYIQVVMPSGSVWRQTYSYASGNLTGISGWVKQ